MHIKKKKRFHLINGIDIFSIGITNEIFVAESLSYSLIHLDFPIPALLYAFCLLTHRFDAQERCIVCNSFCRLDKITCETLGNGCRIYILRFDRRHRKVLARLLNTKMFDNNFHNFHSWIGSVGKCF